MEDNKKMRFRVVFASVVGSLLEWYDFFLFAVVATIVFNKQFFPSTDQYASNMLAWGSVAVATVTRPIGGFIFGHFGDRIGRKSMLMVTLIIMGTSTVLIGCLPTYSQIGVWAPVLLIVVRVFQGIGLGGEWGGAVLMTYEYATPKTKCFYSSLTQLGIAFGLFMASGFIGLMSKILDNEDFQAWGWRVPFWASIIMLIVGWYIRSHVMESPEFQKDKQLRQREEQQRIPLVELCTKYWKQACAGFLARGIGGVGFNIMGIYIISYLTHVMNVPKESALLAVNVGTAFMAIMIPLGGFLADKYGVMKIFIIACLVEGCCSFPIFYIITHSHGTVYLAVAGVTIYLGFVHGIMSGLSASFFSSIFPVHIRYTGISFSFMLGSVVFAGATPMIALYLTRMNDDKPWLVCGYMLTIGMTSAISSLWIKKDKERRESQAQNGLV